MTSHYDQSETIMQLEPQPEQVDVEIRRTAALADLRSLDEHRASSEDGIALNHSYVDVRGWDMRDVELVQEEELELLKKLALAGWTTEAAEQILEEHFSDYSELAFLDPGMGAAVFALSAAGATPISSCNGGTIGSQFHAETVPSILFAAGEDFDATSILKAAETANLGLIPNGEFVEMFADQVLKFHAFSRALISELKDVKRM